MERAESEVPVPPPLPSLGSLGGSDSHTVQVKTEVVAESMHEPQNVHPRKAAGAGVAMIKLAQSVSG